MGRLSLARISGKNTVPLILIPSRKQQNGEALLILNPPYVICIGCIQLKTQITFQITQRIAHLIHHTQ